MQLYPPNHNHGRSARREVGSYQAEEGHGCDVGTMAITTIARYANLSLEDTLDHHHTCMYLECARANDGGWIHSDSCRLRVFLMSWYVFSPARIESCRNLTDGTGMFNALGG